MVGQVNGVHWLCSWDKVGWGCRAERRSWASVVTYKVRVSAKMVSFIRELPISLFASLNPAMPVSNLDHWYSLGLAEK